MTTLLANELDGMRSTWERNRRKHAAEAAETAERIARVAAQWRGVAPGTPVDAEPTVIDATRTPALACPTCGGAGFLVDASGELRDCRACGVADQRRAQAIDRYSSGSERAQSQTFETFAPGRDADIRAMLDAARAFAANPRGWLVLCGSRGIGKSHLCAAIWNALSRRAIYVSAPDFLGSLKACFDGRAQQTFDERLRTYQAASVLIIDDLGAEKRSEWTDATWFELLDHRYRHKLATVVSSNFDLRGDAAPLDSRLIDRMNERGFAVVRFAGGKPSYRRGGAT